MTTVTRDTRTIEPAGLFVADTFDPTAAALPHTDDLDPTRVRLTGLRPAEWATEAACAGNATRDLDPWHPGPDGEAGVPDTHARLTCQSCPVRLQCLALALASLPLGDMHGMWAGYTVPELRTIARARHMADRTVAQHGTRARRVAGCSCTPCKRAHAVYVAELRAQERYAESDAFEAQVAAALPTATPTTTPLPSGDLFSLLADVS